jgi:hypothetical protein
MKTIIALQAVFVLLFISGCNTPQEPILPKQLNSIPIPTGLLGYPLGTYLTIEGVRMEKEGGMIGTRTLLVDTINGRKLVKPVSIWIDNAKRPGLPKNKRCVIRGYESGKMVGVPIAVIKAENVPVPQTGWQFSRYFIITSVVAPDSLKKK